MAWKKKKEEEEKLGKRIGVEILNVRALFREIQEAIGDMDTKKEIDELMKHMTSILPFWAYSKDEREKRRRLWILQQMVKELKKALMQLKSAERLKNNKKLEEEYVKMLKDTLVVDLHALAQIAAGNVLEPVMNRPIVIYHGKSEKMIPSEEEEEEVEEE